MRQPPVPPRRQEYNIQVNQKLSPLQNTLLTFVLGGAAIMILLVCCGVALVALSVIFGLGLFGALLSQF